MFTFRVDGLDYAHWKIVSGFRIWAATHRFNRADRAWKDACTALEVSQLQVMGAKLRAYDFTKKHNEWKAGKISDTEMEKVLIEARIRDLNSRRNDSIYSHNDS
jgi:hypothetical protein